jgi:hypothetical protein
VIETSLHRFYDFMIDTNGYEVGRKMTSRASKMSRSSLKYFSSQVGAILTQSILTKEMLKVPKGSENGEDDCHVFKLYISGLVSVKQVLIL